MADQKISQLPSSSAPLAGTEVLPIVQSGSTVQTSVSSLTSGRTVSMNVGLVNTTTARSNVLGSITNSLQIEGTAGNTSSGQFIRDSASASGPAVYLGKSRGTTVNSNTIVQSGDTLGRIDFLGADGANLVRAASIYATVDATPGTNDMPGRLALLTSPDGTVSPIEQVVVDSAGLVTISTNNVVINTAAKGINFTANTPAAGKTSQLLNWYEEGTWTPTVTVNSGTATSYTIANSVYTRIGRQVTVKTEITPIGGTFGNGTGYCSITGLPFQPSGAFIGSMGNTANFYKGEWSYVGTNGVNTNVDIGAGITITVGNKATLQVTYFV